MAHCLHQKRAVGGRPARRKRPPQTYSPAVQ